ncbi:MAG: response regulator transcription factor [Anaerolineales bacterium]|nr:response regulator transcription factor [Anaerolineales bacterium]MCB0016761.1 response regulator transcription factor [Anaerolineales bacterium]
MTREEHRPVVDRPVRIVIADDHPVVRAGLKRELQQVQSLQIVGEADNGQIALEMVAALSPDLLLLDINMPGMNGIQVMERLNRPGEVAAVEKPRVLVLSTHQDPIYVFSLIAAGANGYLLKHEPVDRLLEGIAQVMSGQPALSNEIQQLLLQRRHNAIEPLSARERDVLQLVAIGYSDQEIGQRLDIAVSTVRNHVTNIYSKLPGVASRAEAVTWAWQNGIVKI